MAGPSGPAFGQTLYLWDEGFTGLTDGATSDVGATAWSINTSMATPTKFEVETEEFIGQDTQGEAIWTSESVSISSPGKVLISVRLKYSGTLEDNANPVVSTRDSLSIYYKLDASSEVLLETFSGSSGLDPLEDVFTDHEYIINDLNTNTGISVIIKVTNNDSNESYSFDDVRVRVPNTFYSFAAADWEGGSTWSIDDISSCSCSPSSIDNLEVEHVINITASSVVQFSSLIIESTGGLNWTGSNEVILLTDATITLNSGSINGNVSAVTCASSPEDAKITLNADGRTNQLVNNGGTISGVCQIEFGGSSSTLNLSGTSGITLNDDFVISGTNNTINNNSAAEHHIIDDIHFTGTGNTFNNNGDLRIDERLEFGEVGVSGNTNTFNNSATLIVGDGGSSGTDRRITVNDANTAQITNNSAGDITVIQNISISDASGILTIDNHGTIDVRNRFSGSGTGNFNNHMNATWSYNGSAVPLSNVNLDCRIDGENTFRYYRSGSQSIIQTVDGYYDLTIEGTSAKNLTSGLTLAGDLNISGSASLNAGTNTITFNGTTDQIVQQASGSLSLESVVVNKSSGTVSLNSTDIDINNSLTLTDGTITTNTSVLTFLDGSTASGGSGSSFIDGRVVKIGNADFEFPIGKNGVWAPLQISGLTDPLSSFRAEYFGDKPSNRNNLAASGIAHVTELEYWNIERLVGTDQPNVWIFWKDADASGITDLSDLVFAHYNSSIPEWEPLTLVSSCPSGSVETSPGSGICVCSGSSVAPGGSGCLVANVTSFSPVTFASSGGINPLPIELMEFSARSRENNVILNWKTGSEKDNDKFILLRAEGDLKFDAVGEQPGQGNSTEPTDYEFIDHYAPSGTLYYKLEQVDYNGQSKAYETISLNHSNDRETKIFPNPITQDNFRYAVGGMQNESQNSQVVITIKSINGNVITRLTEAPDSGEIDISRLPISPGNYIIEFIYGNIIESIKVIVQ